MGVKSSGELSFTSDIVGEYGGTAPHSFSEYTRGNGEVPDIVPNNAIPASNSDISFSDFYGTTDRVALALQISGEEKDYNIYSNMPAGYVQHATDLTVTIGSNALVGSNSTSGYALDTGTGYSSTDTLTIINNGTIIGKGGNGGTGGNAKYQDSSYTSAGTAGTNGGNAFRAQFACSFTNNGNLHGGGGGGPGGAGSWSTLNDPKAGFVPRASSGAGGGGGAGFPSGTPGVDGNLIVVSTISSLYQSAGGNGTAGNAQSGGIFGGGDAGEDGYPATNASSLVVQGTTISYSAGNAAGGLRGFYLTGQAFVNNGSGITGGSFGGRVS